MIVFQMNISFCLKIFLFQKYSYIKLSESKQNNWRSKAAFTGTQHRYEVFLAIRAAVKVQISHLELSSCDLLTSAMYIEEFSLKQFSWMSGWESGRRVQRWGVTRLRTMRAQGSGRRTSASRASTCSGSSGQGPLPGSVCVRWEDDSLVLNIITLYFRTKEPATIMPWKSWQCLKW